jgi:hypothetical protein
MIFRINPLRYPLESVLAYSDVTAVRLLNSIGFQIMENLLYKEYFYSFICETYGDLPHVPLPGNEYTVRIRGNQTMGNCYNLENQIIGNCCNLGNGDLYMVHITETGNLLAVYD